MRFGCVRGAVTVTVHRTFPSGPAKPSRHTGVSSRRRSTADPPPSPNGPRTRDTQPGRHHSTPRPPAYATGGPGATAWHDRPSSSTRHRATLPASAVHRSPHILALRPARNARTPRQRRPPRLLRKPVQKQVLTPLPYPPGRRPMPVLRCGRGGRRASTGGVSGGGPRTRCRRCGRGRRGGSRCRSGCPTRSCGGPGTGPCGWTAALTGVDPDGRWSGRRDDKPGAPDAPPQARDASAGGTGMAVSGVIPRLIS